VRIADTRSLRASPIGVSIPAQQGFTFQSWMESSCGRSVPPRNPFPPEGMAQKLWRPSRFQTPFRNAFPRAQFPPSQKSSFAPQKP